jgi:hypothetical protein
MAWLFISVVLIAVVYLAVQFATFRTAIWVLFGLLFIVVAAGTGWLYHNKNEYDKREALSRRLIRPNEVAITDAVLGQTYGSSWKVKGNVTNRSSHELSGITLKIAVQDCPVSGGSCTTIGEDHAEAYSLSVPPNQMRAFDVHVNLQDMPKPTKWEWTYTIQEVRGKVK